MLAGGLVDEAELLLDGAGAEEQDHDEGMGEADFCAIDGAIAGALDDGEQVMVGRVEDDALDGGL